MTSNEGTADVGTVGQAKDMAGCGCGVLIAMVLGPVATGWIGLASWLPAAAFVVTALIVAWTRRSPFKFGYGFLLAMMLIGAVGSIAFSHLLAAQPDRTPTMREVQPAPVAPSPTPESGPRTEIPPLEQKQIARLTLDELADMFDLNQIAGAQFFETHTAVVTGRVVRVREALGTGILVLRSRKGREMELGFDEVGTRQLGRLEAGNSVEATCPKITEMMGHVFIACTDIGPRER